jgi:PTH1 family peptidyl-tRNA hydrolase
MKLIVGLGNPGKEYENTKHNMGFKAIDEIAKAHNIEISKSKFNGLYNEFIYNGEKIMLLKPQLYINLSGDVIKKYVDFYKINIEDLLIISDDLDMEVGKLKIKFKGSSGGHNGLKNIESNLKTKEYRRIKIGISNNKNIDTKNYVLSKFSKQEAEIINSTIKKFPDIFEDYMTMSFDNLMNKYN